MVLHYQQFHRKQHLDTRIHLNEIHGIYIFLEFLVFQQEILNKYFQYLQSYI